MNGLQGIAFKYGRTFLFLTAMLLHSLCAESQSKADKIDKLLSTYAEYGRFNGSVLVADQTGVIYKNGFGWANVEWEIPNEADTKFRLASITKQFTALLIMQLVEQGKLALDVPISTYLPEYPKESAGQITIHNLLTHTSGIPNYTSFPNYREVMRRPNSVEDLVHLFADSTLLFAPGERHEYSNSAYVLLGKIIEKTTGKSYEAALQDHIFTPLNMEDSGHDYSSKILKKRAAGYYVNGRTFINASYIDMSTAYSAGGIYSTVEDLYRWDRALYKEGLVTKTFRDLMFEKHSQLGRMHYGYGWELGQMPMGNSGERIAANSHSGGINGFNTLITRIPSSKCLIVLLSNAGGAPLFEMTMGINGILHDKPHDLPKKSLAYDLLDWINTEGVDKAASAFRANKASDKYYLREHEVNLVGYELLQADRAEAAARVFLLNIEAFPKSSNAYDSYGEALLTLGKKEAAIENYRQSVRMNPGNENGIKVLEELGISTEDLIVKIPVEHLRLLAGVYISTRPGSKKGEEWKITVHEQKGELFANDRGYKYKLVPRGGDEFINPDDGASITFDSKDKQAITMMLFGKYPFKKME